MQRLILTSTLRWGELRCRIPELGRSAALCRVSSQPGSRHTAGLLRERQEVWTEIWNHWSGFEIERWLDPQPSRVARRSQIRHFRTEPSFEESQRSVIE